MRKFYHLSTCNTCQRIRETLQADQHLDVQDVKQQHVTAEELDWLREQVGSYESLFNRRARKYRAEGLHERDLSEKDYRELILGEYTFLKRPIVVIDGEVYAGNSKKTVAAARERLQQQ